MNLFQCHVPRTFVQLFSHVSAVFCSRNPVNAPQHAELEYKLDSRLLYNMMFCPVSFHITPFPLFPPPVQRNRNFLNHFDTKLVVSRFFAATEMFCLQRKGAAVVQMSLKVGPVAGRDWWAGNLRR